MTDESLGGTAVRAPWRNPALVVALVALAAALVVFGWRAIDAYRAADDKAAESGVGSFGTSGEREELIGVSEKFAVGFATFGPKDLVEGELEGLRTRMEPLITDKFGPVLERELAGPKEMATAGYRTTARTNGAGVVRVEDDAATTLVSGEVTTFREGEEFGNPTLFRFRIELRKIDGEWRVDEYVTVREESGQ